MMSGIVELVLTPREAFDPEVFKGVIADRLGLKPQEQAFRLLKRSIDARSRTPVVRITGEVVQARDSSAVSYARKYPDVSKSRTVVVVGAGPAGLFAALQLIEAGIKPVVLERGKDVRARRRDLAAINKEHVVNPESNYCFGEGGAGTYSDGKLYTRATKRGDVRKVLEILVAHGAPEDILFDAHPHVGTNKLPALVQELRESILHAGGEVRFNTRVTGLLIKSGSVAGVMAGERIDSGQVILATGHSARDIFEMLHASNILVEQKPYSIGVRVEHPQQLIDRIQYHCESDRGPYLPASSYSLVHQVNVGGRKRGVFSFCMCPGGFIVPSATDQDEVVVNGMSPSRRDSRFANSGIVVEVSREDFLTHKDRGPLAGMHFQREIERRACKAAGSTQAAPAQRLTDFVTGKVSATLPETSYQPGLTSVDLAAVLPEFMITTLRDGFRNFDRKMRGYLTSEAQVVAVESRTSSPVRIPRDRETLEHPQVKGLYPCGEGAGYAGGIVSAAMDGIRCAEVISEKYGR